MESIEQQILEAEENVARIEGLFADPEFHRKHGAQLAELTAELEASKQTAQDLYARWEELESIKAAAQSS